MTHAGEERGEYDIALGGFPEFNNGIFVYTDGEFSIGGLIGFQCQVDTDAIKDAFAYRLLFGKEFQNNWRKLHGLPMKRWRKLKL